MTEITERVMKETLLKQRARPLATIYLTEMYCKWRPLRLNMNQHQMTLEDYKQQVYYYLTTKLKVSTTVAKNRMNEYGDLLEVFLEEKYPVSAAATAMMYNY